MRSKACACIGCLGSVGTVFIRLSRTIEKFNSICFVQISLLLPVVQDIIVMVCEYVIYVYTSGDVKDWLSINTAPPDQNSLSLSSLH